jgi:hypothetical protein
MFFGSGIEEWSQNLFFARHRCMGVHPYASLILDVYSFIRFLGPGGFGEVWHCRSEATGDHLA